MSQQINPRNTKACEPGEFGMEYTDMQREGEREVYKYVYIQIYMYMNTHVQICHNTSALETPRRVSEESMVWGQVFCIFCTYAPKHRDERLVFCNSVRSCVHICLRVFVRACAILLHSSESSAIPSSGSRAQSRAQHNGARTHADTQTNMRASVHGNVLELSGHACVCGHAPTMCTGRRADRP